MKSIISKIKEKLKPVKKKMEQGKSLVHRIFQRFAATKAGVLFCKLWKAIEKVVKIPFVSYLLLACVLNLTLETLSRHSLWKAMVFVGQSPLVFFYNVFIIFVTLSLVQFAKRKVFATVFVCAVWIVSAFANFIVLCFRTTPFSAIDMLMIRNVMTMLDKYMTKWQMVLSAIGIILVIILLVYLYIRLPKSESKRHPFRASAYVCMSFIFIMTLTKVAVETQTIADNFGNLAYAYNDYGFAYCFSNSIIDVGIGKPKEYSEELVNDIVNPLSYNKDEVILVTKDEYEAKQSEKLEEGTSQPAEKENVPLETDTRAELDVIDHSKGEESVSEEESSQDGEIEKSMTENQQEVLENTSAEDEPESENSENSGENGETENVSDGLPDEASNVPEDTREEEPVFFENEKATIEHPNIIVIQLESIFDTKYMKGFVPSADPMPTFTWLKNQYSSGFFTVPAVGAGTANTEFEVQTGMSTQFFGAGEYPFKTIMRSTTCDSMAYDLKRLGYATAGFHNNDATFYERHVDYSNLGFDTFAGMEHMYMMNYTPRGWGKDDVLDDIMIERMKQTEGRDYITTISVQAHGRYPKKYTPTLTNLTCHFEGQYAEDEEKRAAWTYYINMCRETDNMMRALIDKLERLDEPTVLFMYGDHLPSLSLEETDLDGITLYDTEWVMWDNIGLSVEKKDMKAYQASTYLFERLNLPGGLMQNFHKHYMSSREESDYLHMLEILEYDTLYGNNYAFDGKNPFPQTDMIMGLREIRVDGYSLDEQHVIIEGEGFNEFSVVYVDGKAIDTKYINYKTLQVSIEDAKDGSELYVAQAGDDHVVLSVTEAIPMEIREEDIPTTEELTQEESLDEE